MTTFPGTIDSFTDKVDDADDVLAAHVNALQNAVVAIETELGTDPAGSQTDVKTRLAHLMSAAGYLEFDQETLLTISSGAITVTQNLHRVETEAGAASDNLDTINGHSNGLFLIVRASNDAHTVVIRHDEGNILCTGGANISLDSTDELAWGYYDGTLSKWILMRGLSGEALTGAGVDNQVAVFTGASTLDSSNKLAFTGTQLISGSDSYPVSSTPQIIAMSESGWGAMGVLGYGSGNGAYLSMFTARGTKASPTATQADDLLGRWVGGGYDAASDWAAFSAAIEMYATENFDGSSHGSKIVIKAAADGATSPATVVTIEGDSIVINEDGGDIDTRIEGSGNANLFFVDAGNDRVGIKTNTPGYDFDVNGTAHADWIRVYPTITDTSGYLNAAIFQPTINPASASSTTVRGFYGGPKTHADCAQNITGIICGLFAQPRHYGSGTLNNIVGFLSQPGNSGIGTITTSRSIWLESPTNSGGGTLVNAYGLYISSITTGSAKNYAIFTLEGLNKLGDQLFIDGSGDRAQLIVQANATQTNNIVEVQDSAGNADIFVINRYERMGFGESNPGAKAHISQSDVAGDCPTLLLMQYDVDKEIVYFGGTAASGNLTRNLVDEGDQSTTTLEGWIKINVQDDGNQITDATYYIPFYTLA